MTLMNTLIDLQTSFYSIAPTGIIETATDKALDVQDFIRIALGVAILGALGFAVVRTKFAMGTLFMAMIGGGLATWLLIFNGLEWLGQQFNDELSASAVTAVSSLMA